MTIEERLARAEARLARVLDILAAAGHAVFDDVAEAVTHIVEEVNGTAPVDVVASAPSQPADADAAAVGVVANPASPGGPTDSDAAPVVAVTEQANG